MNYQNFRTIAELENLNQANIQTGPFGTQLKASEYVSVGIPVINVRNIGFGNVKKDNLEYVDKAKAVKLHQHILHKGDIVFARKGAVERHALIDQSNEGWIQGSDCLRLRVSGRDVYGKFLSYYLRTKAHQDWMIALCSFGATMNSLNQDIVRRISFPDLSVTLQKKIAAILSAYDDLIENNKRRIGLLEKMAEEIYREWFVRFRFPGHDKAKSVKGIPEGWQVLPIGMLCEKVTDGSHFSPGYCGGGKPMASVKDMHSNGFSQATMKTISQQDFDVLAKGDCKPRKKDVLIAKDGSYLKHSFVWNHDYEVVVLSSIAILRPDLSKIAPYFLSIVLKQESTKSMMSGYVSGSALPRIILKDFKKMRLLIPKFNLVSQFESIIEPIYKKINLMGREIEILEATRDRLLPRLISGKLSVENLDIQFPPSMRDEEVETEDTAYA